MYVFLKLLSGFFCRISRKNALALGGMLVKLFALLNVRRNSVCYKNMEIVLGGNLSDKEKEGLVSGMYRHFGKFLADFLRFPLYKKEFPDDLLEYDGKEALLAAYNLKKGVIFITAHFGMWEFQFSCLKQVGIKGTAVVKDIRNRGLNRFIMEQRDLGEVYALHKKNSAQEILRILKRGEAVGFILDQNMSTELGVFVDFGSEKACTLSAPALLASRFGIPVFSSFIVRTENDRYRMVLRELKPVKTGNRAQDLVVNTQIFSDAVLEIIRQYPEQWIWLHKRFKNRPAGMPKLYGM